MDDQNKHFLVGATRDRVGLEGDEIGDEDPKVSTERVGLPQVTPSEL